MDLWNTSADLSTLISHTASTVIQSISIKKSPEDFIVREELLFPLHGTGEHLYLWVQKRDMSGEQLQRAIYTALKLGPKDIGMAGMKDKKAITYQWVSVPRKRAFLLSKLSDPRLSILNHTLHTKKLRTGQLRGNHFHLVLRDVTGLDLRELSLKISSLNKKGFLNYYGPQRFGKGNSTLFTGLKLIENARKGIFKKVYPPIKRLAISAVQSAVFNYYVFKRAQKGLIHQVIKGDIVITNQGRFIRCDELDNCQALIDSGQAFISGPIIGPKMYKPDSESLDFEKEVFNELGIKPDDFVPFERIAAGTRRPIVVRPGNPGFLMQDEKTMELNFFLPAGSYATVLLANLSKEVNS